MPISCDPSDLADLARCMSCIPPGMLQEVKTDLICQWAEGGSVQLNNVSWEPPDTPAFVNE